MKELKDISKRNPFKVPDNYLEEVNRKIISRTADNSSEIKVKNHNRKLRTYLAIAASVAILAVLSFTAIYIFSIGRDKSELPGITLNDFSDNWLNEVDILTLEERARLIEPDAVNIDINSKDIIDYLVLENIDINDIYGQL